MVGGRASTGAHEFKDFPDAQLVARKLFSEVKSAVLSSPVLDFSFMEVKDQTFILFSDIVESVRIFDVDEYSVAQALDSVLAFLKREEFAGLHSLQKVSGDGLILTASRADHAVRIALEITEKLAAAEIGPERKGISTRTAITLGALIVGDHDVYGSSVNLAARLAGSALPGEVLLTEGVRRHLSFEFDRKIQDCGERFLRNIAEPVRVHALRPSDSQALPLLIPDSALRPLIAVLPFQQIVGSVENYPLGEAFADAIITELSSVSGFAVLSRMSTSRVMNISSATLENVREHLNAHYVISGHCAEENGKIVARVEMTDVRSGVVLWSEHVRGTVFEMLDGSGPTLQVVERAVRAIVRHEHARARARPLDTVENYTLLVAGVSMMHGLSQDNFARARELLETLAERASRQSTPLAWLAKWHVLHVLQDLSSDPDADARIAIELTRRAIDADPDNALAHAVQGFAYTNLLHNFDKGDACYDTAIGTNASEPLSWLLRGALRTFTGDGAGAVADTDEARRLSPADPHRYFFLALAAGAHLSADNNETAIALAEESLRSNRRHLSTLRVKLTAEWRLGMTREARETTQELLRADPKFRLSNYKASAAAARFAIGEEVAQALKDCGAPV